ncbi:MAG: IS3 family transposase [[Actinobacillus] rossii]|nr:IS3 family transposase [[Actinobacillus] rossii]MDY4506771.1 IS3 family transposase [[Actinobacillus] rossii]
MSESAYYARLKRRQAVEKHTALAIEIKVIVEASRQSAGKRTVQSGLRQKGIRASLRLIRNLMIQQGLFSKQPQKWHNRNKEIGQVFANHLNREFTPDAQTTVLCGDTTYIKVNGVWCYLAV